MSMGSILTTVNAPHSKKLDGTMLAACLKDMIFAKTFPGHMSSFLGEVQPKAQLAFAEAFAISKAQLIDTAKAFANYSGEEYPLAV